MRLPILVAALLVAATVVAIAPSAEARQVCTYGTGEPCDDQLVCVWNRVTLQWDCFVRIDPCWFVCW